MTSFWNWIIKIENLIYYKILIILSAVDVSCKRAKWPQGILFISSYNYWIVRFSLRKIPKTIIKVSWLRRRKSTLSESDLWSIFACEISRNFLQWQPHTNRIITSANYQAVPNLFVKLFSRLFALFPPHASAFEQVITRLVVVSRVSCRTSLVWSSLSGGVGTAEAGWRARFPPSGLQFPWLSRFRDDVAANGLAHAHVVFGFRAIRGRRTFAYRNVCHWRRRCCRSGLCVHAVPFGNHRRHNADSLREIPTRHAVVLRLVLRP